ncbi:MAG: hypothetical protein GF398_02985 [Chitinivibrionales bacterium]|nr:hypothetical protein [Chitinivibrionales bacterium]
MTLHITDDPYLEGDETVVLKLSYPVDAVLGTDTIFTCTIEDDDRKPEVSFVNALPSRVERNEPFVIPVYLSSSAESDIQVTFTIAIEANSATRSLDFVLSDTVITFAPGDTLKNISLGIQDDGVNEPAEVVVLQLLSADNAPVGAAQANNHFVNWKLTAAAIEVIGNDPTVKNGSFRIKDKGGILTANFAPDTHTLVVDTSGNGSVSPNSGKYIYGTPVTLPPIPDAGWSFSHWTGDLTGNANPGVVTMDREILLKTLYFL